MVLQYLLAAQAGQQGVKLYRYKQVRSGGQWDLLSTNSSLSFYDINEDTAGKKAEWQLELGKDVEVPVTNLFELDIPDMRVTLVANDKNAYTLKFPSIAKLQEFGNDYKGRLFENTYGLPSNSKNRDKVSTATFRAKQGLVQTSATVKQRPLYHRDSSDVYRSWTKMLY